MIQNDELKRMEELRRKFEHMQNSGMLDPGNYIRGPYIAPQTGQLAPPPKPPILERLDILEERVNSFEVVAQKMIDELSDRIAKLDQLVRG